MVNVKKFSRTFFLVLFFLTGCSSSDNQDLLAFMEQAKTEASNQRQIESLPAYPPYVSIVYGSAGYRSPFEPPRNIVISEVRGKVAQVPDMDRPKEFLEGFNIAELSMVGTIEKEGVRWALVKDGRQSVHRVKTGNYLGKSYGLITNVRQAGIDLKEIVVNGRGGWIERPRSLNMRN